MGALEDYGFTSMEEATNTDGVITILAGGDDTSKEAVDELVTQFIEKIEQEANAKDT